MMTLNLQWAVITPSYNLDFERCSLLCRSMDSFLTGTWHHYIIVDPSDLRLFSPLSGPRRAIIDKREILPKHLRFMGKVPFMRLGRMWWSWHHGPVFGWQMQQLVKISMASFVSEDAMIFFDSDVFFLKPFDVSHFERNGKVRFGYSRQATARPKAEADTSIRMRDPIDIRNNQAVSNSIRFLGLNPADVIVLNQTDQLVVWHRATVLAMQKHLENLHHKPWQEVFGSTLMFSEYALYGHFVTDIQNGNPYVYEDTFSYCKSLWTRDQAKIVDIAEFCRTLTPEQVAVCIQSLIGAEMKTLENEFEVASRNHA